MSKMRKYNTRSAKLSNSQVIEIRQHYADGWSQGRLAREFDMSVVQIGRIVRGESHRGLKSFKSERELRLEAENLVIDPQELRESIERVKAQQNIEEPEFLKRGRELAMKYTGESSDDPPPVYVPPPADTPEIIAERRAQSDLKMQLELHQSSGIALEEIQRRWNALKRSELPGLIKELKEIGLDQRLENELAGMKEVHQ